MKKKDKKNPMALSEMACTWDEWKLLLKPFFSAPNYTIAFPEVDKRPFLTKSWEPEETRARR